MRKRQIDSSDSVHFFRQILRLGEKIRLQRKQPLDTLQVRLKMQKNLYFCFTIFNKIRQNPQILCCYQAEFRCDLLAEISAEPRQRRAYWRVSQIMVLGRKTCWTQSSARKTLAWLASFAQVLPEFRAVLRNATPSRSCVYRPDRRRMPFDNVVFAWGNS